MVVPVIVDDLQIPPASSIWPASAFALTAGGSLLIFGRLVDIYGGQNIYIFGLVWFIIWSLIAGFSTNAIMLDCARAFQGLGPAAFLTSGVSLLGLTYPPGRRKNVVFSVYGGSAPLGFFLGILVGGLTTQLLSWRWYFWIGAILSFLAVISAIFSLPRGLNDRFDSKRPEMDWVGSVVFFGGLVLVIFAITDSAFAPRGWRTSYIWSTFIIGILALIFVVIWEGCKAKDPLLPLTLFKLPNMAAFTIAQFFSFGVFGIWLFYVTLYMQDIIKIDPLQVVAWFVPFGVGGLVISAVGGLVLHRVPGWVLLAVSGVAWVVAPLLFALMPDGASYWAWVFPAMLCGTLGIDIAYNVSSIFITTTLSEDQQGLAGAVLNSLMFLGISIFLGFAGLISSETGGGSTKESYKAALWFAVACAGVSLSISLLFVRMPRASAEVI